MYIAKTIIEVGDKTFKEGEAVTGLSSADIAWMSEGGYIVQKPETTESKSEKKPEKASKKKED